MSFHKKEVCSLYRRCLRLAFDWISQRDNHRRMVVAIRRQFDQHREESNPERVELLKDATRYLLWNYRHPEPYIYPTAPGGVAYDREPKFPPDFVQHGFNENLKTY